MARVPANELNNDTDMMDKYGNMFAPGSLVAFDDDLDDSGEALGWSKSYAGEIFIYFSGEDKTYGAEPKDVVLLDAVKVDTNPTTKEEPEENKFKRIFNIDADDTNKVDVPKPESKPNEPADAEEVTPMPSQPAAQPAQDAPKQSAAAVMTAATAETLIPGVVVVIVQGQFPRRYGRNQLYFVASFLKKSNTWKLLPVNGEYDRPGSYLKIGSPDQVKIVKVRGSL